VALSIARTGWAKIQFAIDQGQLSLMVGAGLDVLNNPFLLFAQAFRVEGAAVRQAAYLL
jgi:hypothetical protein